MLFKLKVGRDNERGGGAGRGYAYLEVNQGWFGDCHLLIHCGCRC